MKNVLENMTTPQLLKNDYEYHTYEQDTPPAVEFHNHDFYEFYFFIDGTVTYCIEEKTYDLMSGDVLIIPPEKLHKPYVSTNLKYKRSVLWLRREYLKSMDKSILEGLAKLRNERRFLINLRGGDKAEILSLLSNIDYEINLGSSSERTAVGAYITLLLIKLIRITKIQPVSENSSVRDDVVPSIIEYINSHLSEDLKAEKIADEFFISKYYLQHIFKKYTNVSLYDYIISKRIIYSKTLIRHGKSMTDTCFMCGFKDYSTFYKAFLKKTGINPKTFKNNTENLKLK